MRGATVQPAHRATNLVIRNILILVETALAACDRWSKNKFVSRKLVKQWEQSKEKHALAQFSSASCRKLPASRRGRCLPLPFILRRGETTTGQRNYSNSIALQLHWLPANLEIATRCSFLLPSFCFLLSPFFFFSEGTRVSTR